MKKTLTLIASFFILMTLFTACGWFQEPEESEVQTDCEHNWKEATCKEAKTCTLCQATEGEAKGHSEEVIPGKAATCIEKGLTEGKKCSICGDITVAQKIIPAKGHVIEVMAAKNSTCTENGLTEGKKCSVCESILVAQDVIVAIGHTDANKDAKCDVCKSDLCKNHSEQVIDGYAATCTQKGLTAGKRCSVCGDIIVAQKVIPEKGHTEASVPGCEATCTENGLTEGKKCSVCGDTLLAQDPIPARGHTAGAEATCTAPQKCAICGVKLADAKGHVESTIPGYASTCTRNGLTDGKRCSVCGKITVEQNEIASSGHKDENNDAKCDVCKVNLCVNHVEETVPGYAATCTKTGLTDGKKCSVCGDVLATQQTIPTTEHVCGTDDGDITTAVTCVNCDYVFVAAKEAISLILPTVQNGTIVQDRKNYAVGDTVTLTITPSGGFYQKLYINGEPLFLDWKTNTYSFVATNNTYQITGGFESGLNAVPKDANRWDTANQAHGILNAYYPNNNDAWNIEINDSYAAVSVNVKNYLAGADGNGGEGFAVNIGFKLSNNKEYVFRVIKENGVYKYQRFGIGGSDWAKKNLDAAAIAAICGQGADFKLERTEADTLLLYVNGVIYDTYQMDGVTEDITVSKVIIGHYGNSGAHVALPFKLTKAAVVEGYQFNTNEIGQYTIVYDEDNSDYATYATQLADQIYAKYGKRLSVVSDKNSTATKYEILLGDTNRYNYMGRVMEYSVTVDRGKFRINVGGSCSAEKAIAYLCDNVFNGQQLVLSNGQYYQNSLLTSSAAITSGSTARVMSANILADSFSGGSHKNANYRVEIFAGMLVSFTPDVIGLQENDKYWNAILDVYLTKIQKTHGITYDLHLERYEDKRNYTSLLYRSDKFKVETSGVKVFSWWSNSAFNHGYHMRNITWAQFSSLSDSSKKFVVANTHWSYRTEHADGNTYLAGASSPIAINELREQCKNETNSFMTQLKQTYASGPVFLTGDFNTSLPYFTQSGWEPTSYKVLSEEAKNNGTALSTVPTSGHFDHLFGTGNYSIKSFRLISKENQHSTLSDHPFVYADLAF